MTQLDPFPVDQNRIIKSLEKRIEALEALIRQKDGAPVTKASGSFFLPNSGTPATPVGGAEIYGSGGEFRVITSAGVIKQMPGIGVSVATPAFPLTNATPTYVQGQVQTIVDTVNNDHTALLALLASLRGAGTINT